MPLSYNWRIDKQNILFRKAKSMSRNLPMEVLEGEIAIIIDYKAGISSALDVLQGAMSLISALDTLDSALLSSIDSSLDPISILNDVQHSSLKILLARALKNMPDELIKNLEWKQILGSLLIKAKHELLQKLDGDAPEIQRSLDKLEQEYDKTSVGLIGYKSPKVSDVQSALKEVSKARAMLPNQEVIIQTELGDINLSEVQPEEPILLDNEGTRTLVNKGIELFKIKALDMLGTSQWTVIRHQKMTKVDILHQGWLAAYHKREHVLLPGDSLECRFEETVTYDADNNEIERKLCIVEIIKIIHPPLQDKLL